MRKLTAEPGVLALNALAWLVADGDGIERFLSLSGLDTDDLRAQAGTPEMGVAVLDFLLAQEDLLLRFCEMESVAAPEIHRARARLSGDSGREF